MFPCPECEGRGEHIAFRCSAGGIFSDEQPPTSPARFSLLRIPCDVCKGKRKVRKEVMDRRQWGEKFKAWRISKRLTLRKAADRLDLDPRTLYEMCAGIKPGIQDLYEKVIHE